jgi:hypothetical protein
MFGACLSANPGVEVWLIEGLDMWIPEMNKMDVVAPVLDGLQRLATLHDVAVIATVGSPKQKGKERYSGRDGLFGSAALARKAETIVTVGWTDDDDPNSVRKVVVMPRTGQSETLFFTWVNGRFDLTREPQAVFNVGTGSEQRLTATIAAHFADGSPLKYVPSFGPERTYYHWLDWAKENGLVHKIKGRWYLQSLAVSESWRLIHCQRLTGFLRCKFLILHEACLIYHDFSLCVYVFKYAATLTHTLTWGWRKNEEKTKELKGLNPRCAIGRP